MASQFFKISFVIFIFVLTQINFSNGQIFQGTGVIINNTGDILTNAHVIGNNPKAIVIENDTGGQFQAIIKSIDYENDIALISIQRATKYFAYIRMDDKYNYGLTPIYGEEVNIIGYPKGEFEPRGGLVSKLNSPKFFSNGFSIGLSTTYGCSGAPILDEKGLLIGLLWGGANDDGSYKNNERMHLQVYGLNANIILPFIYKAEVKYGISSPNDAPISITKYSSIERIDKIINRGSRFTVKILCEQ